MKLREWFIKRLKKQLDAEREAIENAQSKGNSGASFDPAVLERMEKSREQQPK